MEDNTVEKRSKLKRKWDESNEDSDLAMKTVRFATEDQNIIKTRRRSRYPRVDYSTASLFRSLQDVSDLELTSDSDSTTRKGDASQKSRPRSQRLSANSKTKTSVRKRRPTKKQKVKHSRYGDSSDSDYENKYKEHKDSEHGTIKSIQSSTPKRSPKIKNPPGKQRLIPQQNGKYFTDPEPSNESAGDTKHINSGDNDVEHRTPKDEPPISKRSPQKTRIPTSTNRRSSNGYDSLESDYESDENDYKDSDGEWGAVKNGQQSRKSSPQKRRPVFGRASLKLDGNNFNREASWRHLPSEKLTMEQYTTLEREKYMATYPKLTAEQERATRNRYVTFPEREFMASQVQLKASQLKATKDRYVTLAEKEFMKEQAEVTVAEGVSTRGRYVGQVEREYRTSLAKLTPAQKRAYGNRYVGIQEREFMAEQPELTAEQKAATADRYVGIEEKMRLGGMSIEAGGLHSPSKYPAISQSDSESDSDEAGGQEQPEW